MNKTKILTVFCITFVFTLFWNSQVFPNTYEVFYSPGITWHDARANCESLGGHLATISSQEEDDYLTSLLEGIIVPPYEGAFIGLSDELNEGVWEWVTGEPLVYTNWDISEPFGNGDYVMKWMYSAGGYLDIVGAWNDVRSPTGYVSHYICEFPSLLTISPPSGVYVTTQNFDLTLIVETEGVSVVGGSATFDGSDVTSYLAGCLIPGTLVSGGQTFRCPNLTGGLFGTGTHTLDVTLDLSDGSSVSDTVTWEVKENTEP